MKKRQEFFEKIKEKKKDISKCLTTSEIAELLGVTNSTIIAWTKKKKLSCIVTDGGHRRYPIDEYERILEKMKASYNIIYQVDKPTKKETTDKSEPKSYFESESKYPINKYKKKK